jgi:ABC-type amino acid transport system permease subunit
MNNAYKKECWLTLVAFLAVMLMTHIFPVYFMFKGLTQTFILGFPTHYFLTIVIGWLVLMPLFWIYIGISEQIDREIEESTPAAGAGAPEEGATR